MSELEPLGPSGEGEDQTRHGRVERQPAHAEFIPPNDPELRDLWDRAAHGEVTDVEARDESNEE